MGVTLFAGSNNRPEPIVTMGVTLFAGSNNCPEPIVTMGVTLLICVKNLARQKWSRGAVR